MLRLHPFRKRLLLVGFLGIGLGAFLLRSGCADGDPHLDGVLAHLQVPAGFKVSLFASGLNRPRRMAIAPSSRPGHLEVWVSESWAGRVTILRDWTNAGRATWRTVFADDLQQPYGIAFSKLGWVYVGMSSAVVRFRYQPDQARAAGNYEQVAALTAGGYNQHWTRNLLFSPDGRQLYVTVGSSCNVCEEGDAQRAAISVMNPDGSAKHVFASGMRNPVGMAWRPDTDELWTVVNERDLMGDDLPPDFLTRVRAGGFYGWPYAWTDLQRIVHPDPHLGAAHPDRVRQTTAPSLPVQAHSAVLGVAFMSHPSWPETMRGDAFLASHGSWNRTVPTGYKVMRVHFVDGQPQPPTDFLTGFLRDGMVHGRPVDIQPTPDGSLLVSDDKNGCIWRISPG